MGFQEKIVAKSTQSVHVRLYHRPIFAAILALITAQRRLIAEHGAQSARRLAQPDNLLAPAYVPPQR